MLARACSAALRAPAARRAARGMCTRTDGFTEALPRRDVVAPLLIAGVYGFAWTMADEGRIRNLVENTKVNTDPEAAITPDLVFQQVWPFVAGTLGMLFDSIACKFSQTADMDWLCTDTLNDDTNAAIALSLLTPAAEHNSPLVRAICERKGALRRLKEIILIYKTLPREQHDDVVVNAATIVAKVASIPELREEGMRMADFVWMMPDDKAQLYTQYGIEGLSALWKASAAPPPRRPPLPPPRRPTSPDPQAQPDPRPAHPTHRHPSQADTAGFVSSGGLARLADLAAGPALRPSMPDSSYLNQMLAHRLLSEVVADKAVRADMLAEAHALETKLAAGAAREGRARRKTLWQAAGVHRGETELEAATRQRQSALHSVRGAIGALRTFTPDSVLDSLTNAIPYLNVASAGAFGALYGGARGWFRGWWQEVTPSVCRELSAHVAKRSVRAPGSLRVASSHPPRPSPLAPHPSPLAPHPLAPPPRPSQAVGAVLLVGFFELAPKLKKAALDAVGAAEERDLSTPAALKQLVALDAAYIGVVGALNFFFPFILVPVAFNPAQFLVLPNYEAPPSKEAEKQG